MAEWTGLVNTTINKYLKDFENDVMRNRKILAKLQSDGRVTFDWTGKKVEWRLQYRQNTMQGVGDSDALTFARNDLFKVATLDWRGYAMTDMVSKKERLMNSGKEAIINRYSEITKLMTDAFDSNLGDEFYIDGNAAGNEKRFHGIESFMGTTGSAVSGSVAMAPSDSFADLSTVLGNEGGSWSGNWPKGTGSPEYDYYSPLILDVTSTLATASGGWASATATWAARCLEVLRYGLVHTARNKSAKGLVDIMFLNSEYWRQFLDALGAKEHIMVQTNARNTLRSLGFSDTVSFDGAEVTFEYGTPASSGYGFNTQQMELRSLQSKLIDATGPHYNMNNSTYEFLLDCYGNMAWGSPRYFLKFAQYGSSGA